MLASKYRVKNSKEFQKIYINGFKARGEYGMLIFLPSPEVTQLKFGFVVSAKIGNAVTRQKIKRQLSGIFQELINNEFFKNSSGEFSYIIHKKPESYKQLKDEIHNQLKQFNLKQNSNKTSTKTS